jgi:hypothetical protein
LVNVNRDFNTVAMTSSESTREFYLGYALMTVLADDTDLDGDGMFDAFEAAFGLSTLDNDASLDLDGDGLSNFEEFQAGTAPNSVDSDGDGMTDGWELDKGLDPLLAGDASLDSDGDGFSNLEEYLADRDPLVDEQSGDRLVPIFSVFDNPFLTVPAVQIGEAFFDLELEAIQTAPTIVFELIGFTRRAISVEVPDANRFDLASNVLSVSVTGAADIEERFFLEFVLTSETPPLLQLTNAIETSLSP